MPKCLNIKEWRAATKSEIVAFLNVGKQEPKGQRHLLVVRTHLRPIDVYAYLKARFGAPNGFQNFLRKDDSDNWIHWDFNLKADDADLYFAGTSRDIHIVVGEPLTDEQWKALIISLKHDFRRLGRDKSDVLRGFEKFVIFQNKYVSLAGLCADLHAAIVDTPPYETVPKESSAYEADPEAFQLTLGRISDRAEKRRNSMVIAFNCDCSCQSWRRRLSI